MYNKNFYKILPINGNVTLEKSKIQGIRPEGFYC